MRYVRTVLCIILLYSTLIFANELTIQEVIDKYESLGQLIEYTEDDEKDASILDFYSSEKQYTNCSDFISDIYSHFNIYIPAYTKRIDLLDSIYSANESIWQDKIQDGSWREVLDILEPGDIINGIKKNGQAHCILYYGNGIIVHSTLHTDTHGSIFKTDIESEFNRSFLRTDEKKLISFKIIRPFNFQIPKITQEIITTEAETSPTTISSETVIQETITQEIVIQTSPVIEETTAVEETQIVETLSILEEIIETQKEESIKETEIKTSHIIEESISESMEFNDEKLLIDITDTSKKAMLMSVKVYFVILHELIRLNIKL